MNPRQEVEKNGDHRKSRSIAQLGPRPFYLVEKMDDSPLKRALQQCADRPIFFQTDFSIGHRGGGPLQFPEHTEESHAARAWTPASSNVT